ncbi:MAG: hypothetical protein GX130_03745 [Candidatus Hydrogenedens sp.]|nr:hypothetical protein [Candidatus Hydrogenedens sp.]
MPMKSVFGILLPMLLIFGMVPVSKAQGTDLTSAEVEELWFEPWSLEKSDTVFLETEDIAATPATEPLNLILRLSSRVPYQQCRVTLLVSDQQKTIVQRLESVADLHSGLNEFHFQWDGYPLQPGLYDLSFTVDYSDAFPPLTAHSVLRRISSTAWLQDLEHYRATLDKLSSHIAELQDAAVSEESSSRLSHPYLDLRLKMARRSWHQGKNALSCGDWQKCSRNLEYLQTALPSLEAALIFSPNQAEYQNLPLVELGTAALKGSGFEASGSPLFLFGLSLPIAYTAGWDASSLKEMAACMQQQGLNFFVLNCPVTLDNSEVSRLVEQAASASVREDLLWMLQFQQEEILGKLMDAQPTVLEPGFVNLAHEDFNQAYKDQLSTVLSQLGSSRDRLIAVSLAENPRFHYDREEVRQAFIKNIEEKHPDRMTLNRLWHAKLASYDEITIWGNPEEDHYHSQRAYQYEWQIFHRSLITDFFTRFKNSLIPLAADLPLSVTLAETAFSPGETRHAVGREEIADLMDLQACRVNFAPGTGVYALNYPVPNAYFSLMRSHEPSKAVLNLRGDIDVSSLLQADARCALVRAALWESVMSGATGLALPYDSSVLDWPDAFEAFAETALHINRLGKIVSAFQEEKALIGILFSEAAKIMDDGVPHLESTRFAFEGASFAGYSIQYLTENQMLQGGLEKLRVLIMPETMAISDAAFEKIDAYVADGGMVARVGTPIPYNESGISRSDVIRTSPNTVLVRGMNLPTEYLHAMDAVLDRGRLPLIPRPINAFGYPLEGVRSRYVNLGGHDYLYIINLRHTPVSVHITGGPDTGRDLILSRDVSFPRQLESLEMMLIRLDSPDPATNVDIR